MERTQTICVLLLVTAFLPLQSHGFSFSLKPVGTTKVTATPGELITYNAHLTISASSPLSFHVSLPYHQTPIMNVELIEVIGIGNNLDAPYQEKTYYKEDSNSFRSRSQASVDLGNVTRNMSANGPGDDVVVQVQARLLEHANVTTGAVFWLYFGMYYQKDAVWVIGKTVKADVKPGPAKIGVSMRIPNGHSQLISEFEFKINIYHLPDSKSSATELTITLSVPSYLTSPNAVANGPSPAFTLSSTGGITITFSEAFKVGQKAQLTITMTYSGSEKGKFVGGNIYGSFQYKTTDKDSCVQTVEKKEALQMAFNLYAKKDTCDEKLNIDSTDVTKASSAFLPCCSPQYVSTNPSYDDFNWEPWYYESFRIDDEFIQLNFQKKTTVSRIRTAGFARKTQFVRNFHVSHSQNGVHWKYITHMGKKKTFEANSNAVDNVINLFPTPLTVWFLRIHVLERSPAGASMKVELYGCEDPAATKTYEAYQRGFLPLSDVVVLCNVHPDRTQAKTNCYGRFYGGLKWDALHPSIVNIIGYHESTGTFYGMGVTSDDSPVYMILQSANSVRVITEADWNAVKSSVYSPTVVPLYPAHGFPLHQLTDTAVTTTTGITYLASPEGLLKTESGVTRMIASWTKYTRE